MNEASDSKSVTRNWNIVNDQWNVNYSVGNKITYSTEVSAWQFACTVTSVHGKFIQYTIYWDKIQMLQKFPLDKINVTKIAPLFPSQAPTNGLLYKLKYIVHLSKTVRAISIFDSVSFLSNFIFLFNKKYELFDFTSS